MLWSSQVRFGATAMAFNARNFLGYRGVDAGELAFIQDNLAKSDTRANIIEAAQNALLYGSAAYNTGAGLQTSRETYNLFLENGCVENSGF